jgi:hypothetical protein
MLGTPFSIQGENGIYQYSETLYGGEIIYCVNQLRKINKIVAIDENWFSYRTFSGIKKVLYENCYP